MVSRPLQWLLKKIIIRWNLRWLTLNLLAETMMERMFLLLPVVSSFVEWRLAILGICGRYLQERPMPKSNPNIRLSWMPSLVGFRVALIFCV